ncbi:ABC-type Zn uptake system ZnuABC Zn-binding protein ZnuA [Evansella vedderi]|uniref:ABC-type Zn uptake system ZnuABC Zn-binding protein ZnuA n=1 Tax=Evansella vedderi TaxID=38282 RepID=A0ABU0A1D6_9BACI|nr:metal ABC transporter substrate-binding protein [Evansella vedderi]MDQ0257297.1 ABC-type Zn uptake system ZnuABC Zn-binding protein ZnuA [Evansella vedderi]
MFKKKSFWLNLSFALVLSLLLAACGSDETAQEQDGEAGGDGLTITTSFSVLGDIVAQVIGDRGSVEYIVPVGEEPHEYEPVPSDFQKVSDADVFYVNGLDLEEWLEKIVENVTDTEIITLSNGVTAIPLEDDDEDDPHAWLSPKNVIIYVENLLEDLIERDPEGEDIYTANAEAFISELNELDAWIEEQVQQIPEEHRVIVVSENAFKYFGADYGFLTEGIWEINSHEEGTPQQFARLAELVRERNVPGLFVETTVDNRYMETVSNESGVPIVGEVYTDAIGEAGSGADTYIGMMRHNVQVFVDGLSGSVATSGEGLNITTSFSVLGDIIAQIIGDRGTVDYIVPVGEEPHEYEPVPSDFQKVSDADVFYVNGLDLEEWLEKIVSNVTDTDIVTVSGGVTPIPLEDDDEDDPHAWLSPKNVIIYVENILNDLIERDPQGESVYTANAEAYIAELEELDAWIQEQVQQIPEEHRVIVVSENAFKYFGADYGFHTEGIWEINSHEEGTPQQFARLAELVQERNVPGLFVETTVDNRYMETVSNESGVPIVGEVYTDAIGEAGSGADTYIDMMRHNVQVFVDGLS